MPAQRLPQRQVSTHLVCSSIEAPALTSVVMSAHVVQAIQLVTRLASQQK